MHAPLQYTEASASPSLESAHGYSWLSNLHPQPLFVRGVRLQTHWHSLQWGSSMFQLYPALPTVKHNKASQLASQAQLQLCIVTLTRTGLAVWTVRRGGWKPSHSLSFVTRWPAKAGVLAPWLMIFTYSQWDVYLVEPECKIPVCIQVCVCYKSGVSRCSGVCVHPSLVYYW